MHLKEHAMRFAGGQLNAAGAIVRGDSDSSASHRQPGHGVERPAEQQDQRGL